MFTSTSSLNKHLYIITLELSIISEVIFQKDKLQKCIVLKNKVLNQYCNIGIN